MRPIAAVMLALLCSAQALPAAEKDDEATKAVQKKLAELKSADLLRLQPIAGEPLARVFPGRAFVLGFVPSFPVARVLPEDAKVKPHNLFVVKEGKVELILSEPKELEKFFQKSLQANKEAEQKDAARCWLLLTVAFLQDGFYKFTLNDDSFKVAAADGKNKATGQMVVMQGGNGTASVALTFDQTGKLLAAEETSKIRPGPRPICQATKLLDPDPIVRRMAEQDLRIMGRAARPYLKEQRARAHPELQRAIDRLWQKILRETDE